MVLRERDHVAQVRLAGQDHRHPVDSERDSAHRRRAHGERVEQEAELRALLLFAHPEQIKDLRLDLGLVDPEAAATELVPVHDQVVGVCERVLRIAGEPVLPFLRRPRERVMNGGPAPLVLVALEHREVVDPEERELRVVDHPQLAAQVRAQRAEHA